MKRVLALLLLAACEASHPANQQAVQSGQDCVTCHLKNYQDATNPVHVGVNPTTCQDCHTMTAWSPALGGNHPESAFPIAGGAHMIPCQSCHNSALGSSTGGQNTDCIGCHTGEHTQAKMDAAHTGVTDYQFDSTMPHFCLTCHPDGKAASHPESKFPIASGAHRDIPCNHCHDSTLGSDIGGMNVNCIGCHSHSMAAMASTHSGVGRYLWSDADKKFCLTCHPTGRGG